MASEGPAPACNGEAEAELSAAKGAVAAVDREGEAVGGDFVIVNGGDSDGLSDRCSDPGRRSDEDSPLDEDDRPPTSNAGPDVAAGGVAGAELGASRADLGVPSAQGHDRAAVEAEDGVGKLKGEQADDFVAELPEQETASREQAGAEAQLASGIDHAGADSDSAVPAVDSDVNGNGSTKEESDAAVELPAHEGATEEHDGIDTSAELSGQDQDSTFAHGESISTALQYVACAESKGEPSTAQAIESVELDRDESGDLMVNGHHDADISADSCVTATEPVSPAHESKEEQGVADVTELGEQDAAYGEQNDDLQANGHDHLDRSADYCISASEFKACADESIGQQCCKQGASIAEAEILEGMLDTSSSVCSANVCEQPIGKEAVAKKHGSAEDDTDASGELEPGVEDWEGETKIDEDSGGNLYDDKHTADAMFFYKETKPLMKKGITEATAVADLDVITENKREEIVHGDELGQDGVSVGTLDSVKPESYPFIGFSGDQKAQVDVAVCDENTTDSDVNADSMVEMNTAESVPLQELSTAVEDRSIPLYVSSSGVVDEKELKRPPCPEEVNLAECDVPHCPEEVNLAVSDVSSVQTGNHDQLKAPCVGLADKSENGAVEAEPGKVVAIEVADVVSMQADKPAFHNGPTSVDMFDNDSIEHLTLDAELGSHNHIQAEECSSREICSTNVDQVVSGASMLDGTDVAERDELSNLCSDSKSDIDRSEVCDTCNNEVSFTAGDKGSSPINELPSSAEDTFQSDATLEPEVMPTCTDKATCLSDEAGKDICFGDVNAHTKSSHEVETKCLEVVLKEHKNDDKHAYGHADEANIVEDSNESHLDADKSNKGDTHAIRQQWIYLIKVPKLAGEDLWEKTQNAQIQMDQLTQERDAINFRKQKQKAVCDEYRKKLEAARLEEKEARAAHGDKKHDLNSVRSMIGKLNKANSIEEIDEMIARKEKIMEHETISLKEEKLFIKEINELKAQRKQLCSNMGSRAEISEAFHQKDHIHEQHKLQKTLKKDSDVLFNNLKSLEENTRKIQKSYDDERTLLRELNEEFRAANEIRQKAYRYWAELKAEPVKKNEYFFKYRRDRNTAFEYLSMGDMEGLQLHCNDQVERILGIWNKDDEFRNLYVEANKFSTLRRLGTHDGRRLGPEEDPPVIPNNFNRRPNNPSPLTVSSPGITVFASEVAPERPVPVTVPVQEDSFPVLPSTQISKHTKSKASGRSPQKQTTTAPVTEREDVKHIEEDKARLMEEELELVKKAELSRREEELREERAAAEKERLRLEQKAKAKEAEERKKRKADKAQERAEFKARKEAEVKEKKKAKKDKRNGGTPADSASGGEGNSSAISIADTGSSSTSENTKDGDVSQQAAPRRASRPAPAMRQLNRVEPMPLPLRNRARRRMRQYILIAVAVLSVIALILAVSYIHFPSLR